ncbi:hypothetical protein DERF_000152 [Dermatophagoides farinae]|uniref:Uncharacterized protein n=1 Tax=Dermatophagoides farinae TaxID=6954 RepID=A0A922I8B1_DERFA|nr:hypothetical protein DERF_000152 [Dermatophagoides farinae]
MNFMYVTVICFGLLLSEKFHVIVYQYNDNDDICEYLSFHQMCQQTLCPSYNNHILILMTMKMKEEKFAIP